MEKLAMCFYNNLFIVDSTWWEDYILAGWPLAFRLAFSESKMAANVAPAQNQMWLLCFGMSTLKYPRKNSILFCVDISKDLTNIYTKRIYARSWFTIQTTYCYIILLLHIQEYNLFIKIYFGLVSCLCFLEHNYMATPTLS